MHKISIILLIFILGLGYTSQDNGTTQVLNPQFKGIDLSIPKNINFQGYLYRDGIPMDTTMNMWFGIYTALSGGSLLFQQTINNVEVVNGWFTVSLDNIPNSVFPVNGATRYLEVKAPSTGPALDPRISLVSVGYSYHSITSDTAEYAITGIPTGSAGGDLAGTYPNPTVDGLRGRTVASTAPSTNQVLKWTGSQWAPGNDSVGSGTVTSVSQSTGITCTPNPITTTGTVRINTSYTDNRYINVSGDSMTGDLAVTGDLRVYDRAKIGANCSNIGTNAFAVGYGSAVSGNRSSILGGWQNSVDGTDATVAGGAFNHAATDICFVGAGQRDTACGRFSGVLSGYGNRAGYDAADTATVVAGGYKNRASVKYSFIGGGQSNAVNGYCGTVGGGLENWSSATYGGVLGGYGNVAGNSTDDTAATVAGGYNNSAIGKYSFVGGGRNNIASNYYSTVFGGRRNRAIGSYTTIAGGDSNIASVSDVSIGGGYQNSASGIGSTISGGRFNSVSGTYSTVCGGYKSYAGGIGATAVGYGDSAMNNYSFTVGYRSMVPSGSGYSHSAAFNSQTATGSSQLRCDDLNANSVVLAMDHPLDLDNKILNQFAVISPEILVTFRGTCVIGSDGKVKVNLPDYFDALCRNPMIQLTGIGTYEIFVAEKIKANRFVIGGQPGTEVYWTVTGERKDQLAEVTRTLTPVEKTRTDELIGRSINEASLANKMPALEQKGFGSKFHFRTAAGKSRYESSRKLLESEP